MRWHIGFWVTLAALGCGRLEPLAGEATLEGRVVERDGAGVGQARVLLIDGQTASAEVRTDASGHFSMPHLSPGAHSVLVLAGGERGTWRKSLELRAGGVTSLDALELESVWAFPEVLWLRGVGFDEQWGRGADSLLLAGEGVEPGTLIATRTTATRTELVQVERDGSLTVLHSTAWSPPQPDDAGFVSPEAPGATLREERVFIEVPGHDTVLFDLRSRRVVTTVSRGSELLAGNHALAMRDGGVEVSLVKPDGSELPLPELIEAARVGDLGVPLYRLADGHVAQLTAGGLVSGDEVPADVTWGLASPGFVGAQLRTDGFSLLWLDPALHLHVLRDEPGPWSGLGRLQGCGRERTSRGLSVFGPASTVWSVRDGVAVSTAMPSQISNTLELCLAGERVVVATLSGSVSIASARLGEPLAATELPGDLSFLGTRADGRVFLSRRSGPRLLVLEPGQPLAGATPVGTVPYLYGPLLELRDGAELFSGLDPRGGTGWFRVEVAP